MRALRVKDRSLLDFVSSSESFKLSNIQSLIKTYPHRQFILVGDAGEKDPEIYRDIGREFPNQVLHVCIRLLRDDDPADADRFRQIESSLGEERFTLFRDSDELARLNQLIARYARNVTTPK